MNDSTSSPATPARTSRASRWNLEWWAAFSSIPFSVLLLLQDVIRGTPPRPDDTPLEIRDYYADHRVVILLAWLILAVATVLFFFWLASLWRAMRLAEGGPSWLATLAIAGGISGTATTLLGTTFAAAAAHRAAGEDPLEPTLARTLFDLSGPVSIGWIGFVVIQLAVILAIWRTALYPGWVAWFAAGLIVLWFIQAWPTPQTAGTGTTAALDYTGIAAIILTLAWIIVIGVIEMKKARAEAAAVAAAPTS